jgi:hypothetical protein
VRTHKKFSRRWPGASQGRKLAVGASLASAMLLGQGGIALASTAASRPATHLRPHVCKTDAHWEYDVITAYGGIFYGVGTPFIGYNTGSGTASYTRSVSGSYLVQTGISITGEVDISDIISGAKLSTSWSLVQSHQTTGSASATANSVPPGHYAIIQFGSWRWYTYGHNYYVNGNCTISNSTYPYTKIPRASVIAADVAQNTTGNIPWDHQPGT